MKRYCNYILAFMLMLSCFCFRASAQSTSVEAILDKTAIRIGEQATLRFQVITPANVHVTFPKLADTITGKVQVVSKSKPETIKGKNGSDADTIRQNIVITSFDAGTYKIPPFEFHTKTASAKTDTLTLQVETVAVDTTKAIYDIKQPLVVTYTLIDRLRDNWLWVALPLLAIAAVIGVIIYLKKRPKAEPPIKEVKIFVPEHIIALQKLEELRAKKLWQQEQVKQYHSELSDILREYIEKRFQVKTHEKTTDEIFTGLRYLNIAEANRDMLKQILVLADLVKFAKERPLPPENEQSMENAVSFVKSTQRSAIAEAGKEGGSN